MRRYVEDFSTLIAVEQYLLNAAEEARRAEHRTRSEDLLRDLRGDISTLVRGLEDAADQAGTLKRALLAEWRSSGHSVA